MSRMKEISPKIKALAGQIARLTSDEAIQLGEYLIEIADGNEDPPFPIIIPDEAKKAIETTRTKILLRQK